MEFTVIDYLFWGFIFLVVIGGVILLLFLLPKEHAFEEKTQGCYRIKFHDGQYTISRDKPRFGENIIRENGRYFYITNMPFPIGAYCDEASAKDGKSYRGVAEISLIFPAEKVGVFAPVFQDSSQEAIKEVLEEAASKGFEEAIGRYEPAYGKDAFMDTFKACMNEKLGIFGVDITKVNDLRISENKQTQKGED